MNFVLGLQRQEEDWLCKACENSYFGLRCIKHPLGRHQVVEHKEREEFICLETAGYFKKTLNRI